MARGNPEKPFTKENASEMGKKGGYAKRGKVSLKACLKRIFASGEVDPDVYMKALIEHAMVKGNGQIAKLITEMHDGKEPEKLEIEERTKKIEIEFIEKKD